MPHIARFNRFPSGNLGGIVTRPADLSFDRASVSLFMPPLVKQEILLNVPGLPRKAFIDTGEMKPVLTLEGNGAASRWRLRVASRDSMNKNVWSPLTFANVWHDARVCWGNGNRVPTTFASAWTDFWTAPFNRDLAADVRVQEYGAWIADHADEFRSEVPQRTANLIVRATNDQRDRMNPRNYAYLSVGANSLNNRRRMLTDSLSTFDNVRRELRRRSQEDCANRGVGWVAVNHKAYMRVYATCEELKRKIEELRVRIEAIQNTGPALYGTIRDWAADFAERIVTAHLSSRRIRGARRASAENHGYHAQQFIERATRFRLMYRGKWTLIRAYMRAVVREAIDAHCRQQSEVLARIKYEDYVNDRRAIGLKEHFCENKWPATLVFREIQQDLKGWGESRAFPACDGVFSIPVLAAPMLPLPAWQELLTIHDPSGHAYQTLIPSKFAFFRRVSDKVNFLFYPGMDNVFLTNGKSVRAVEDETFAVVLAELEAEELEKWDPVHYLNEKGWRCDRVESLDRSCRNQSDPNDDRADEEEIPDAEEQRREEEPDEEPDEEEIERQRLEEFREQIVRGCACAVCVNRCGCDSCYAETAEHDDDDGNHIGDCECAACCWISNHHETMRDH